MNKLQKFLKQYDYLLPKSLIAQIPAKPRDTARLLVYSRKARKTFYDQFSNLDKYLPKNSVLVFNQTRVIPARLRLFKETGGKVSLLYLGYDAKQKAIKTLANKRLAPGMKLFLSSKPSKKRGRAFLTNIGQKKNNSGMYFLKSNLPLAKLKTIFQKCGQTPLPPYLKNSKLNETQRRREYQSIFAKSGESIAAPTASLHFTKRLMKKLWRKGISLKFINLDVNLGTFAPLREKNLSLGKLHSENYRLDQQTSQFITRAKKQARPIIAVGTTVARTLESAFQNPRAIKLQGPTDLFIRPPYQFKVVNSLITNFHVPKSSLMMLVAALIGKKALLKIYERAVKKQFRFFSFGDGMLIL